MFFEYNIQYEDKNLFDYSLMQISTTDVGYLLWQSQKALHSRVNFWGIMRTHFELTFSNS